MRLINWNCNLVFGENDIDDDDDSIYINWVLIKAITSLVTCFVFTSCGNFFMLPGLII